MLLFVDFSEMVLEIFLRFANLSNSVFDSF